MTATDDGGPEVLGPCAGCGYPVRQGDERREPEGAPGVSAPLLHRTLCVARAEPRATGRRGAQRAPGRPA